MSFISHRRSIRFLPSEPSEPTSTVVLTSAQKRFVDLRINLTSDGKIPSGQLKEEDLDWGIAGTSSSKDCQDADGTAYSHSVWKHWINSRSRDTENAADEGDNFTQPDGSILEKGRMFNPESGKVEDYEEVWEDSDATGGPLGKSTSCIVLQTKEGNEDEGCETRGMMILLGSHCQALMRIKERVLLERWVREGQREEWVMVARMGEAGVLPCFQALERDSWSVGDRLEVDGRTWDVVEMDVCG